MASFAGVPASVGCEQRGHALLLAPLPPVPPAPPLGPAPWAPAPVLVLVLAFPPPPPALDEVEEVVEGASASLQAGAIDATKKMENARWRTNHFFGRRLSGGFLMGVRSFSLSSKSSLLPALSQVGSCWPTEPYQ